MGSRLGPYEITSAIGAGGMGEVYRARDERLERDVAIKVLPPGVLTDDAARRRFRNEALALAKLSHPNIAAVHDVGEQDGSDYLVMERVAGQSLAEKLKSGPLPAQEVVSLGAQVAAALEEAHEQGVVHRDLKPANIMVTPKGHVKVLDFGLAKLLAPGRAADVTVSFLDTRGPVGTPLYMSPEQAEGKEVDPRTDLWSLGVVLYESLAGNAPFQGVSSLSILRAITEKTPQPLPPQVPQGLRAIVERCLAKEREQRYQHAAEVRTALEALQAPAAKPWRFNLRQPAVVAAMVVVLIAAGVLGVRGYVRASRARWAEKVALPEVAELLDSDRLFAAARLFHEAEPYLQSSPETVRLQESLSATVKVIETAPAGARIYIRDYTDVEDGDDTTRWTLLGTSPMQTEQIPIRGFCLIRAVKEGFAPEEFVVSGPSTSVSTQLHALDTTPEGMVWVTEAKRSYNASFPAPAVDLPGYWLDRYEVTNREFKRFVDSGGYQKRDYWKEPFIRDGRSLSWEQALADFRDATGRPGPSTWQLGTYADGAADFPVAGVSWYEAAAYAEYAGKSLPTVYHWYRAAGLGAYSEILTLSNFSGHGAARVGRYLGLGPFGTYDMAGNVKEWVLNPNPAGNRRYILGGAWNEPPYLYSLPDARNAFERSASFGFRCAKYVLPLPPALAGPVPFASRDRTKDRPADDQAYNIYRRLHSYDRTDLKSSVDSVDETSPYWRMEKVTFQAAYGDERVIARLYLPKGFAPPYQTVVYFPGADALSARDAEALHDDPFEFVVRSGRALMFPAYKGMLERGPSAYYHQLGQTNRWIEMNLQWSKDLGRSLDYLETRPDINMAKIAYCGFSLGAAMAPRLIAIEPRFKAAVLLSGGTFEKVPPEVDAWNFAPHVKIPVLMLNGRDDFRFPLETSQIPLFQALGTPAKDKQHVLFDGGHIILVNRPELMKQVLDWLDKYLGPVNSPTP